ncbi:MAG: hypothetical protein JNL67_15895 [Planctomycetaceae bacterium]|nr:hypothetical protein [Planctomycetaceae bacterium]
MKLFQRNSQGWSGYLESWVRHTACALIFCLGSHLDAQESPVATTSSESILVRRDLSVITPVLVSELGPDGVVLESGDRVPWFDILGAQNWQKKSDQGPTPVPETEIIKLQQRFGQPWFLLRSRLARGETLEVVAILTQLAEADLVGPTLSGHSVAARYYLACQLDQQGEVTESWLQWLMAHRAREKWLAVEGAATQNAAWLEVYLAPLHLRSDPIVHLPQTLAFPSQWTKDQLERLQAMIDQPAASLCWVAAHLSQMPTIARSELAEVVAKSFPQANGEQRELLNSCLQTLERIEQWQANAELMASDEVRYAYLELEAKWDELDGHSNPAELERQKLIWQLRLEGIFLTKQADPRLVEAGQLRLLLLEHWGYRFDPGNK